MKKNIKHGLIVVAIGYFLFFIFRLVYGYVSYPSNYIANNILLDNNVINQQRSSSYSVKNYASAKLKVKRQTASQTYSVDQKYEKIADVKSKTNEIEKDEKKVRQLITKYNALIQYEQNYGLKRKKNRVLNLIIGVQPDKFSLMTEEIKKIGTITSLNIDKIDKSNEYKDLKAKKQSLLQIRKSLISLKNKSGKIDEFINLENRILEIESKIQKLGISLGEFDIENEFCTIKFLLKESINKQRTISFLHRIKVALEWSIKYYLLMLLIVLFGLVSTLFAVSIVNRLQWVKDLIASNTK